jgi:glycosyltransferase involved in cell wall biosynthesis
MLMHALWLTLAAASFALLLAAMIALARAEGRIVHLADVPRLRRGERAPRVAIIAPALNEARNIEAAVRSFAAQDYPDLEIVVVDDRSTDATPEILARLVLELPRLRVVTLRELPRGWLGKNHASLLGAQAANAEILVFTDADVMMAPDVITRAVAHVERRRIDHLAAAPEIVMPGLLSMFALYFGLMFTLYLRPWSARDPQSAAHVGIGAFNMVRATAYWAAGGHVPIRLRPDDDLKLGKLLKRTGFRQDFVAGRGLLAVEWYASWRQVRDGLMKNLFAGAEYRTGRVALAVVVHVLLALPAFALLWTGAAAWWLNFGCIVLYAWMGIGGARGFGTAWWAGPLLPGVVLFGAYLMVRATWLTIRRGGIVWRGTHYSLAELRANVV